MPSRNPLRVLLVDDYQDALETWTMFLQASGYDVVTASDGRQAVERALSTRPDVVVMDLELPGVDGFAAARQMRAMPTTAAIPLIAATGYSSPRVLKAAQAAGFELVLVKPCDPERMLTAINRAVEHRDGIPVTRN